jgi:hypothetical protein
MKREYKASDSASEKSKAFVHSQSKRGMLVHARPTMVVEFLTWMVLVLLYNMLLAIMTVFVFTEVKVPLVGSFLSNAVSTLLVTWFLSFASY